MGAKVHLLINQTEATALVPVPQGARRDIVKQRDLSERGELELPPNGVAVVTS